MSTGHGGLLLWQQGQKATAGAATIEAVAVLEVAVAAAVVVVVVVVVVRRAVAPERHVVPQRWLVHTTAPGIAPDDRKRLDLVIHGAAPLGGAPCCICCDATLVLLRTRDGEPHPGATAQHGVVLCSAFRRKHATHTELTAGAARTLRIPARSAGNWVGDCSPTQYGWSGASSLRRLCVSVGSSSSSSSSSMSRRRRSSSCNTSGRRSSGLG